MENKIGNKNQDKNVHDMTYFLFVLKKGRITIFIITFLGLAISVLAALLLPMWYAASVNLVPAVSSQDATGGAGSAISSTLKEFGLTSLGGQSEGTYSYLVILQSRTVIDSIINLYELDKEYEIPKSKMTDLRQQVSANIEVNYEKEGNYVITVWDKDKNRAAEIANNYVNIANGLAIDIFRQDTRLSKDYFEDRLRMVDSSLVAIGNQMAKFSSSTLMFSPLDQAKAFSTSMSELKAEQAKYDIFYEYYRKNFGENDPLAITFKKLSTEMDNKISDIQNKPGFVGNFSLAEATGTGVEYMRLYADFETMTKVKSFLMPMIEKIRSDEIKSIQNLLIVDKAIPPDKKDKPKRSLIVAGGTLGSFVISILIVFLFNYIRELRREFKVLENKLADE
ncbi:MAG: GNVR domain-containing protein [Chloroherpetonaceae bacterium]